MPILRGAVTFARFRVEGFDKREKDWIVKNLRTHVFEPIRKASEDERSVGFVELEDRDAVEFSTGAVHQGEYALFSFRVDTLKVPGGMLREELEKWVKTFEAEHTRPCSRREKNDARAALKQSLRQKLSPKTKTFDVSWNLKKSELQIWAASRTAVEEVEAGLEKAFDLQLQPLAPAAAAQLLGLKDEDLLPTPDLSWPDFGSVPDVAELREVEDG
ncbi:MAG: recombination-associated protein RdgC [Deltaproteobacteria bacterium]|nr:recombination-associated protein RdgC [Deltaproteobacteria bacterium]